MKKCIYLIGGLLLLTACNPTVRIETPTEPIRIEANITIKHEIRIVVEKEVEEIFAEDEGLF
ncbi:MAG: YnbE family lipoprotein [Rhodospirillaceae bacterium]|nr:MAG: YnbE family lipoprotein [Rhodospirillaceae bacterium]